LQLRLARFGVLRYARSVAVHAENSTMRILRRHALLAAGLAVCAAASAAAADLEPFARGSYAMIRRAHAGRPLAVHFWSVTCPTCVAELADWAKIARERRDVDFVFVNADGAGDRARVEARMDKAGLRQEANFGFADDFVERLYFEVDRNWSGELPFTALIAADGAAATVIGAIDDPQIEGWLAREAKR
jgi:thiol-disulfide isomerase/thioredoxin